MPIEKSLLHAVYLSNYIGGEEMGEEFVYEYIEEADRQQIMELLDAVINRFRELHDDWELILLTLPKKDEPERYRLLERVYRMLTES